MEIKLSTDRVIHLGDGEGSQRSAHPQIGRTAATRTHKSDSGQLRIAGVTDNSEHRYNGFDGRWSATSPSLLRASSRAAAVSR
jgi:hypothetical protein